METIAIADSCLLPLILSAIESQKVISLSGFARYLCSGGVFGDIYFGSVSSPVTTVPHYLSLGWVIWVWS